MRVYLPLIILLWGCGHIERPGWHPLGKGVSKSGGNYVSAMAVFNDGLFVGRKFDSAGGTPVSNLTVWNGLDWDNSQIKDIKDMEITNMVIYKSQLYAIGLTPGKERYTGQIERWNGSNWDVVSGTIIPDISGVKFFKTVCVYKDELYIGGEFGGMDSIHSGCIIKYDGKKWSSVDKGLRGEVNALKEYHGDLYVGGSYKDSNYMMCGGLLKWNGKQWDTVKQGLIDGVQWVFSLEVYHDELYVGGDYLNIIPGQYPIKKPLFFKNISRWNGHEWSSAGRLTPDVLTMCVFNDKLIAGGEFDSADGKPAAYLAEWDGQHWQSIDNDRWYFKPVRINHLLTYKRELYVIGDFVTASGVPAFNIVRWVPEPNE